MTAAPVLVTTDLSVESIHAFTYAAEEAQRRSAPVLLLSVLEDWNVPMQTYEYTPPDVFVELKKNLKKQREESLHALLSEHFTGCQGDVCVRDSSGKTVAEEIVDTANERGAGVIVIASHGKGAITSFLLGSVVERVVRLARTPILVVPPKLAEEKSG